MARTLSPRALAAASSGNVLEWYDFTIYGFLAPIIGAAFFPADDPVTSTLSAFAVLAVGYIARPIGSLVFGHVGDRIGRKPALIVSVIIMGACALAIAVLPDYAAIGIAAPILLILVRIIQGVAVAGEYTSSGVLVVESVPPWMRHRAGSTIAFAMMLGCMIGSGVPAGVGALLSDAEMQAWGWRIPFLLGAVVALSSLFLRLTLEETIQDDAEAEEPPLLRAFRDHWREMLSMIALMAPCAILYFIIFVYAASYLTGQMHFSAASALDISTANLLVVALLIPPIGWIADKVGARAVFLTMATLTVVAAIPLWTMMHSPSLTTVFFGQMGFGALNAAGWALSLSTLAAMVPAAVRCSGLSVGYNLGMAVFGGTTPLVATYLVARTGDDFMPAYYLIAATLISFIVIWRLPSRKQERALQASEHDVAVGADAKP